MNLRLKNYYSENIIYLPKIWNSHCGFDFKREKNPPPFIKNKYFTFGSFNNFDKINPNVVSTWSKILKKINNSQLVLKTSSKRLASRFEDVFKTSWELFIFFKILDQVETTFGFILSKLLNEPKVKYLFLINGGGFFSLLKSKPQ